VRTLLLVDDEDDHRILTRMFLNEFGYAVVAAANAEQALALFDPKVHQLVVTDNSMPGMSGVELAGKIKQRSPTTPVLMLTGSAPTDQSCLDAVIQRPVPMQVLREAVDALLQGGDDRRKPHGPTIGRPPENPGDG
jgi:CheY-like chemotaxis protein